MTFQVDDAHDPAIWDGFVAGHPSGNYMQSHAWGDFQRQSGWEPRYCLVKEGGEIRAAALLLGRSVPGMGGMVFHAPRGPVVDYGDDAATSALMQELAEYVGSHGGIFLRCDPYWPELERQAARPPLPHLTRVPRDWSYWNGPRFVFWLDLQTDEDALFMGMTSRCRNDVRRGYRNGVTVTLGTEDDIEEFYRLMVLTGHEKGIAFHGPDYYRRLIRLVGGSAQVQLFLGTLEDTVIAAGVSVVYGKRAWLLYAASDPAFYKARANRTLQWEMIKWAHAKGCVRYDFRGTATNDPPSPQDPGYGVYQFKKSFGPEFTRLIGYYDLVQRPVRYRVLRALEDHVLPRAYRVRTWLRR